MCGRTCCTLSADEIRKNCKYEYSKNSKDYAAQPNYVKQYNLGKNYTPSFNVAPTDVTPVLVSKQHVTLVEEDSVQRSLVNMMWGIIPQWHKGNFTKHGFHTNNARLEGLLESRLFKKPFMDGQRCVVLCDGFYEWSEKVTPKTPYFIHAVQKKPETRVEDRSTWPERTEDLVLLKMAGIFDIWTDDKGDQMWAYSVLTRESDDVLGWLHHRTPVFLETEKEISDWLNYSRVPSEIALSKITNAKSKKIDFHRVTSRVNDSRYKAEDCNLPFTDEDADKKAKKVRRITDFFQKK